MGSVRPDQLKILAVCSSTKTISVTSCATYKQQVLARKRRSPTNLARFYNITHSVSGTPPRSIEKIVSLELVRCKDGLRKLVSSLFDNDDHDNGGGYNIIKVLNSFATLIHYWGLNIALHKYCNVIAFVIVLQGKNFEVQLMATLFPEIPGCKFLDASIR